MSQSPPEPLVAPSDGTRSRKGSLAAASINAKLPDASSNYDPELALIGTTSTRDADNYDPEINDESKEQSDGDEFLVDWDGPDDPRNPRNWSRNYKWSITFLISCVTFVSPATSSIVAPAISTISEELHITSEVISQITISIFLIGYAIGPLVLSALSELYGRKWVLILTNIFFIAFNIGCGFAQNTVQLIVFRLFAGIGGSAPLSIGGGTISDLFEPDKRGSAMAVYTLMPVLGPSLGPIAGGFIAEKTTWRWAFWATSCLAGVVQILLWIFLKETYGPQVLHKIARAKRQETGDSRYHTKFEKLTQGVGQVIKVSLTRPFRLLLTQPIVQFIALYMSFIYGLLYILLTTFPTLWATTYHESTGIGGLNYIAVSLGYALGAQLCAFFVDRIYVRMRARNNGVSVPEHRLIILVVASWLFPVGFLWYGWSADKHLHWIMPDIGVFIACIGMVAVFSCLQLYLIDCYTLYAASALAAGACVRSLLGFGFPLFAPYMYQKLGFGWGNSLLAFLGLGLGTPATFVLYFYGSALRKRSSYARGE